MSGKLGKCECVLCINNGKRSIFLPSRSDKTLLQQPAVKTKAARIIQRSDSPGVKKGRPTRVMIAERMRAQKTRDSLNTTELGEFYKYLLLLL